MGAAPQENPEGQRGFPFQRTILGAGSAEEIKLTVESEAGALLSVRNDSPFELGPSGALPIGSLQFDWTAGGPIRFAMPAGVLGGLEVSAGGKSGGGVYRDLGDAFKAAGLRQPVQIPPVSTAEYLVLSSGYAVQGAVSSVHPVGVLASAGAEWGGSRAGTASVIVRIPETSGAKTALASAVARWRLPRQVRQASDLPPGTWIAAQASGSLSLQILAQIGYDLNFLRELNLLGISHSLSVRVADGLEATVGLQLNSEYVVLVGRENESSNVRLRVFRAAETRKNVGVDLSLQITGKKPAESSSSLVKLVLGIHGLQVLGDLNLLKQWKLEAGDLAKTPARLDRQTGLDLLTFASGIDAREDFDAAQKVVGDELDLWNALPPAVAAELWRDLNSPAQDQLFAFLQRLSHSDSVGMAQAMEGAFEDDPMQLSPRLRWLAAIAGDAGVLSLLSRPEGVRELAAVCSKIIENGVIAKMHQFIGKSSDLDALVTANGRAEFEKLNPWLLARVGDFLDRGIQVGDLGDIQLAIAAIRQAEPQLEEKTQSAFGQLFRSNVAASFERLSADTALLDAGFDLANEFAAQAFYDVMENGAVDKLLTKQVPGVTLHRALLTHGLTRTAEVQLHFPFFDSKAQHVNQTLAALQIEENAGRVLLYGFDSKDKVSASGRFRSELALMSKVTVVDGGLNFDALAESAVSYRSRQVRPGISLTELKFRTESFLSEMIETPVLNDLYSAIQATAGYGNPGLGDVALDFQVALPGSILGLWLKPRTKDERRDAALAMSRTLQRRLKELVPSLYLADLSQLRQNAAAAALLVWSAIPPSTAIAFDGRTIKSWDSARDVFWDWISPTLRNAAIRDKRTLAALLKHLAAASERWNAAGDQRQASFFVPGQAGVFLQLATTGQGSELLQSLLYTEAELVFGAQKALDKLKDCWQDAATAPAKTLRTLADFGARMSHTFNRKLSAYSSAETLRTFNSFLLAEASRALAPAGFEVTQRAALTIFFLKDQHAFPLADFLAGSVPPSGDIRFARVVTNFRSTD